LIHIRHSVARRSVLSNWQAKRFAPRLEEPVLMDPLQS